MGSTVKSAHQFATLTAKKRELDAQRKQLQAMLDEVERELIAALIEEGIAKITVDAGSAGSWTLSANTLSWAKLKDGTQKQAMEILKREGMESLLSINATKLSGMYREDLDAREYGGEVFPEEFLNLLEISERTKVSARKA